MRLRAAQKSSDGVRVQRLLGEVGLLDVDHREGMRRVADWVGVEPRGLTGREEEEALAAADLAEEEVGEG